jgi:membrane-anchored glycerophosphoryl diester phosphodiesterase (GDPDase)
MKLSITKAWDEASAFVKQEAATLFLIAFALSVLPGLILQALFARVLGPAMQANPGNAPDLAPFVAALPIFLLLLIPVILLSLWGSLTINVLALRRETVVGSAFRRAARRILPLLGATLLLIVAATVAILPFMGALGFGLAQGRVGLTLVLGLVLWVAFIFVAIRLMLMAPVAAAEPVGPIDVIRRSWALTAGHFWKLLGFFLLLMIVFLVLVLVVGSVVGIVVTLVAGQPQPGSLGSFLLQVITGIVQAVFVTYFIVLVARIYEQLSGNVGSIGQVFE